MENASKALIIAGAILLSILIITLGIGIYTMASEAMGNVNLDADKIRAYNTKFEDYEGTNVSGTRARSLCDLIRQHNNANQTDFTMQVVLMNSSAAEVTTPPEKLVTPKDVNDIKNTLQAGRTYTVNFGYDSSTGYIVAVGITPNAR